MQIKSQGILTLVTLMVGLLISLVVLSGCSHRTETTNEAYKICSMDNGYVESKFSLFYDFAVITVKRKAIINKCKIWGERGKKNK